MLYIKHTTSETSCFRHIIQVYNLDEFLHSVLIVYLPNYKPGESFSSVLKWVRLCNHQS